MSTDLLSFEHPSVLRFCLFLTDPRKHLNCIFFFSFHCQGAKNFKNANSNSKYAHELFISTVAQRNEKEIVPIILHKNIKVITHFDTIAG